MAVTLPTYDPTNAPSLSLTPDQSGVVVISGPGPYSWAESSLPITLNRVDEVGISFTFGVSNDSEGGLALAPLRPFTAATDDLAGTGETAAVWTLTLVTNLTSVSAVPNLYMVRDPAVWTGTTNTPFLNRTNSTDQSIVVEDLTTGSPTWVLSGSTYNLVWNFDFLTTGYVGSSTGDVIPGRPMFDVVNSPTWSGLFQFHMDANSAISMTISSATFAGNALEWHTGATDFPLDRRARVVHDYITGQPYLSDEAVEDGFREGIMVHPDNYDPPDPLDTEIYTPPPGEGVIDDLVIDTE